MLYTIMQKAVYICIFLTAHSLPKLRAGILPLKPDTPVVLQTAVIYALPYQKLLNINKQTTLDSILLLTGLSQNLADVLQNQSQVFIKNYGPGQLSSAGMRGGSAQHTPILWNGFNLQNPMLGQVDLSLFPVFFFNNIHVNYGGNSGLFGSGAIGGNINLQTTKPLHTGLSGTALLGHNSLQVNTSGLNINYANNRFSTSQYFYISGGLNNYAFNNYLKPNNPKEYASHAAYKTYAWLNNNQIIINKNNTLSINTWLQQNKRQIEPALGASNNNAEQFDATLKLMTDYKYQKKYYSMQVRTGIFKDYLNFTPDNNSQTLVQTIFTDNFFKINQGTLHLGTVQQHERAIAKNINLKQRNRFALLGSYRWLWLNQKFTQQIIMRQEIADGLLLPFTPNYNACIAIYKNTEILINVARVFRLPTFNDLYWPELGNTKLKPEEGWCAEITATYKIKGLTLTTTTYNKYINNWILWTPDNNGLFKPLNIASVWSRGLEGNWEWKFTVNKVNFKLSGLHDFTVTTNQKLYNTTNSNLYKQLIYTPRLRHTLNATINIKYLSINFNYRFSGVSYTTTDHSAWLQPFNVINASAAYLIKFKNNQSIHTQFSLNNLFNTQYELMAARPMPLFSYSINLIYNF